MGEAKKRKDRDSTYGRIPKHTVESERGILISPPIEVTESEIKASAMMDRQELRCALMFWDKLAASRNSNIYIDPGPEVHYLQEIGILEVIDIYHSLYPGNYQDIHIPAFEQLEQREPGQWSMAMGERTFQMTDPATDTNSTSLNLIRAIPVPDEDVAIDDILEIKEKRRDELHRLWAEIDLLAQSIHSTDDPENELQRQLIYVDQSCADLLKTAKEWRFPVKITDLKCTYEFTVPKAIGMYMAAESLVGLPLVSSLALSAVSGFKLSAGIKFQKLRDRSSPFQYVYDIHERIY